MRTIKYFLTLGVFALSHSVLAFTISIDGVITPSKIEEAMSSIQKHIDEGENELTLKLDSPGGELPSAVKLADYLREKTQSGIRVTTVNRTDCSSACTVIFAAGQERLASKTAEFYFHSVGVDGAGENKDQVQTRWAAEWARQIGMADSRLAAELERDETLIGKGHKKTYYGGNLLKDGYSYVTQKP